MTGSRLFSDGATERSTIVAAEYGHRSLARSLFKLCWEGDKLVGRSHSVLLNQPFGR